MDIQSRTASSKGTSSGGKGERSVVGAVSGWVARGAAAEVEAMGLRLAGLQGVSVDL